VSLYFAFADTDFKQLANQLKTANYLWTVPVLFSSLLGSIARSARWRLLLGASGYKTKLPYTFFPLMYGYFVNIGTPRLGEFARCATLQERAKVPFAKSFGTVFIERCVDLVCLLLAVFLSFILQAEFLGDFFTANIYNPIDKKTGGYAFTIFIGLIALAFIGFIVLIIVLKWLNKKQPTNSILVFTKDIIEGVISIFKLKKRALFIFYTLLIWLSYFLTSYLWFFAFEATENLTIAAAFTVMSVGAIAKSLPIQGGGMGAYHFLVGELLILYQLAGVNALAYATLNHGMQLLYSVVLGVIAVIWLFIRKREGLKTQ
jgi:hypothetical protein